MGYQGKLSLQTRFEMVNTEFVSHCKKLQQSGCSLILEFGVQTTNSRECKAIRRPNRLDKIVSAAEMLTNCGVLFEISLIYGLPGQTIDSFQASIDFCRALKPSRLVAWPLMLLRGTELHTKKEEFQLKEKSFSFGLDGDIMDKDLHGSDRNQRILLGVPHVVESLTFSKQDWYRMREMALSL